jgi:hypothetical protein
MAATTHNRYCAVKVETGRPSSALPHEAGVFPREKTLVRACPEQAFANFAFMVVMAQMDDPG